MPGPGICTGCHSNLKNPSLSDLVIYSFPSQLNCNMAPFLIFTMNNLNKANAFIRRSCLYFFLGSGLNEKTWPYRKQCVLFPYPVYNFTTGSLVNRSHCKIFDLIL